MPTVADILTAIRAEMLDAATSAEGDPNGTLPESTRRYLATLSAMAQDPGNVLQAVQRRMGDARLYSELSRFCQEGENRGKPGPCPNGMQTPSVHPAIAHYNQQLDAIPNGDAGKVGGYFVRRTGPNQYRVETDDKLTSDFVQGDKDRMATFLHQKQKENGMQGRIFEQAVKRFESVPKDSAPGGGSLFGAGYLKDQSGFSKLPNGARVVVIGDDEHSHRPGTIVHEDSDTGQRRTVVKLDGSPGVVPVDPSIVEPLDPRLSWRKPAERAPRPQQARMFSERDAALYRVLTHLSRN